MKLIRILSKYSLLYRLEETNIKDNVTLFKDPWGYNTNPSRILYSNEKQKQQHSSKQGVSEEDGYRSWNTKTVFHYDSGETLEQRPRNRWTLHPW